MNYLLLGLGKSNISVKNYFDQEKITYFEFDDKYANNDIDFDRISTIIKSPGISIKHPYLSMNKNIITDLELFYRFSPNKNFITVTGSNGKTTTVNLLKHLLPDLDLGGNVGTALFDFIKSKNDIIIEASSFMLEYTKYFRSKYSVILNLYKTHLEHHFTYSNYIKSKLNLIKNACVDDYLIYNYDDVLLRRLAESFVGVKVPFSKTKKIGVHLSGNDIIYQGKKIYNLDNIKLIGDHNYDNILAAVAVVISYGREIEGIETFSAVEYRLEYLGDYNKIKIYNDSKSTNFQALNSAINSFKNDKITLIGGGKYHKDSRYPFSGYDNIKRVYLFGENIQEMKDIFSTFTNEIYLFDNLDKVMENLNLDDTDILLFSPGSVSYDQYRSFEERGSYFNKLVKQYFKI